MNFTHKIIFAIFATYLGILSGSSWSDDRSPYLSEIETLIVKTEVSPGANLFLNEYPEIVRHTRSQLPLEDQSNSTKIGRIAYEEVSKRYSRNYPSISFDEIKILGRCQNVINLRLYNGSDPKKIILHIHGGGWSRGGFNTHNEFYHEIRSRTGYSVYGLEYRLAPENKYPAALEDVEDSFEWLLKNRSQDQKILVCGDSAGGNLAAALAVKRIEDSILGPDGLLLFYPVLDLEIPETTSDSCADGYCLTRAGLNSYIKTYLGKNYKELAADSKVFPFCASKETYQKLPPTTIIAAQYDPLTESLVEFSEYADSVKSKVDLYIFCKTIHIFAQYPTLFDEANSALDLIAKKAHDM